MTRKIKTIITAAVIIFVIYLLYSVYHTSKEGSGTFSDFDINSTANKNIKVELVQEKGITPNTQGGVTFYVKDKDGIIKMVSLAKELPVGIEKSKTIILSGHLHGDYFHATEVEPE